MTEKVKPILIAAKKIGSNVILTIGKEKYSKKMSDKEAKSILASVELYNKKPSQEKRKAIIKAISPETIKKAAKVEETKAKVKGLKSQAKKAVKKSKNKTKAKSFLEQFEDLLKSDEIAVDKFQELLDKYKKVEETKPEAIASPVRRSGEY